MAATPVQAGPAINSAETLEQRFQRLADVWRARTGHLSSSTEIIQHPAFQEIVGLGMAVVPFMMRELSRGPSLWVWALPRITGANPIPPEQRGKIALMTAAWLNWGKEHGYQ